MKVVARSESKKEVEAYGLIIPMHETGCPLVLGPFVLELLLWRVVGTPFYCAYDLRNDC